MSMKNHPIFLIEKIQFALERIAGTDTLGVASVSEGP